jgi:hypothetical protein
MYRPVSVERIIESQTSVDEDNYTKEYMKKYGVDKVRGGSYANMILTDEQEATLKREFRGADDRCQRCGRTGHFIGTCYAKTEIVEFTNDEEDVDDSEEEDDEDSDDDDSEEEDDEDEDEDDSEEEDDEDEDEDDSDGDDSDDEF